MPKLYLSLGLIVALFFTFAAALSWHNVEVKAAFQAGANTEKLKWQTLLLDSQAKAETEKQRLENILKLERKSWETRINDLKKMRTDCMPVAVLEQLRDAGIYTGPIPCK